MDGEEELGGGDGSRCPEDCPNIYAPYCPLHEDPSIYKRDESKMHLVEAYANNAAREMIAAAVEKLRERRRMSEVRVPSRVMDEWIVFTKKVVLDSGEHTAQGEIERRISEWLDESREQEWSELDRIKDHYTRFTGDWTGPERPAGSEAAPRERVTAARKREEPADKRASKRRLARRTTPVVDAEYFEDDF